MRWIPERFGIYLFCFFLICNSLSLFGKEQKKDPREIILTPGEIFRDRRIAFTFQVPQISYAKIESGGESYILDMRSFEKDIYFIMAKSLYLRRPEVLKESLESLLDGCDSPEFLKNDEFDGILSCSFGETNPQIKRKIILKKEKNALHVFYLSYQQGYENIAETVIQTVKKNIDFQ